VAGAALLCLLLTFLPNVLMLVTGSPALRTAPQMVEQAESYDADCIVVLGASVQPDGTPSTILKDRLDTAIALYEEGVAPKILMSGDNSDGHYNEVMNMTVYAVEQGVDEDDIFCDHAGVNTYDSMYRLKHVFGAQRVVIVTNEYHLYRSLYVAHFFGMEALGVGSDRSHYEKIDEFASREFFARIKDFYGCILNVEPHTKSEPVSLDQSGTVTQWWLKGE
jgi:vancomycin permeability regulator SanA